MLREGSRLLLQDLFEQMRPALEGLEGFVDDLNAYEPPVILPNGDILIRRRPDAPKVPEGGPEGEPQETPEETPQEDMAPQAPEGSIEL
mgnify:CR=1 FL=1